MISFFDTPLGVSADASFGHMVGRVAAALVAALGTLEPGLPLTITVGDQAISTVWASRFGDVPEGAPLCYIDSAGRLALAVNRGSAAATYGAGRRAPIIIKRG